MNTHIPSRIVFALAASALLGVGLAGCSPSSPGSSESPAASETVQASLTLESGWAKAAEGMSGVFGSLVNHTSEDLTISEVTSPRANLVELHETVMIDGEMKMREIEGGFVVPAQGSYELVPGEDHIMLMQMPEALLPGEQLGLTLTLSNGEEVELMIDVRDYAGANESYEDLEHHDHGAEGDDHGAH